MASFGIGLQVLGAAAMVAAPFTGGASLYLFAAGAAASVGGGLLNAQALQPEPSSRVARQRATSSDPEAPWVTIYGEAVVGAHVPGAWVSKDGLNIYSGADHVVACHPCHELVAIQVNEWAFPITTNAAGNDAYNGRGLILNTGSLSDGYPTNWYVPVASSPWWRSAQDLQHEDDPDRAHVGLRWYPGNRTATDAHMSTRLGAQYSGRTRKFIGHTVVSLIYRANTELGTLNATPEVKFRVRGKNDILDATGANPAYTTNPVLIFADICRERRGIPVADIISGKPGQTLAQLAAECDDTTWAGSGGTKKYEFNGVLRDDMPVLEQLQLVCSHMAGGFSERGDKVVLYVGTVKTPWSRGPLTMLDVVDEQVATVPVPSDQWVNGLKPHRVILSAQDEDSKVELYGGMEPVKREVTASVYVTEDEGETLVQDRKYEACITGKQAKFLAWVNLKQIRLGVGLVGVFQKRAVVLEPGDVTGVSMPEIAVNNTLWQITRKIYDAASNTVQLAMVRYEDDIFIPGTTPTEDAIGIVPRNRSTLIPLITGLAAETIDAHVQGDGDIVCDVSVTWDIVANLLVRAAGDIRIAWRRQADTRWRSITAAGDDTETVIPGLLQLQPYYIRARAEGTQTAGREGKPAGKWTAKLSFTPETDFSALAGPPGSLEMGENLAPNWNFEAGRLGRAVGWEGQVTAPGTFTIVETGGKYGPRLALIAFNGSTATQRFRMNTGQGGGIGGLIPVEVGQRFRFVVWVRTDSITDDTKSVDVLLNVQYYGASGKDDFIATGTPATRSFTNVDHATWVRIRGSHTVPTTSSRAISFMRLQPSFDPLFGSMSGVSLKADGIRIRRILGGTSTILDDATTVNGGNDGSGQTWTTIRSVTGATPGSPVKIACQFEGRVGDAGAAAVNPLQLQCRIVRIGPDPLTTETVIKGTTDYGEPFPAIANPGGEQTEGWGPWQSFAVEFVDDTATPGEYVWRAEFRGDNVNAKTAVKNRGISWLLDD